jgi:AbrB family looped-hinge helix DNA binding protein
MALYRTLYYGEMSVGVGGRVTIPQEIRDDLGIGDGDLMTIRVEESPDGTRQMVMWRAKAQREDAEE